MKKQHFNWDNSSVCTSTYKLLINDDLSQLNLHWWAEWAYLKGTGVRIRKAPNLESNIVTQHSWKFVKPVINLHDPQNKLMEWVQVDLMNGKSGFVHRSLIGVIDDSRLCFEETAEQEWVIRS